MDWAIGSLKTASGASGVEIEDSLFTDEEPPQETEDEEEETTAEGTDVSVTLP